RHGGRRRRLRAERRGDVRGGIPDGGGGDEAHRAAVRRGAPGPLPGRDDGGDEAVPCRATGRRRIRREGRSAARRRAAVGGRAERARDARGGGGGGGAGAAGRGGVGGRCQADRQPAARAGRRHPMNSPMNSRRTRKMLRAKIHRATVTEANVDYEGSITIDRRLLDAADLLSNEAVCVWDVTNGNRFETYAVEGPPDSGVVCVNGAAAHLVRPGDLVIIAA